MPRGRFKADTREEAIEKFWSRVQKTDTCWLWTGCLTEKGYGQFVCRHSTSARAHRIAYELLVGPIPEGTEPDHTCRRRSCVNPDCLELVTSKENTHRGLRTKLFESDVKMIRFLSRVGAAQRQIAATYNITQPTVSKIINHKARS